MVKDKNTGNVNGTGYEWEYATPKDTRTTGQKIIEFIYNSENHSFLGRTPKSWGGILLFYAIFYSVLALLFAICMKILISSLTTEYPKLQLGDSIIGTNPGLGFRPRVENAEIASIIWYNLADSHNVETWVNLTNKFLEDNYVKNDTSNIRECNFNTKLHRTYSCNVSLDSFGNCVKSKGYGFPSGQPCVFIKLNRIYDWMPEFYNNTSALPGDMPDPVKAKIKEFEGDQNTLNQVWVSCNGQSQHDLENIGPLEYKPGPGFPGYFYPYLKSPNYMSPLVAVQFLAPKYGVLINVECRAWAKNINYKSTSQVKEGSVHFALQVDK